MARAAPRPDRVGVVAREVRGVHARGPVPRVQRHSPQARGARGDCWWQVHRRGVRAVHQRGAHVPRRRRTRRSAASRSPCRCSRRSTRGLASCSTLGSTTCRSLAARQRSAAARPNAFGSRRRSARASSACCTCSTSRASASTSATTSRLIETLTRLRDLGNTLIVVEHDEDTIRTADWVVDIGPGAGEHGGEVVHSGTVADTPQERALAHGRSTCRASDPSPCPTLGGPSGARQGRSRWSGRASTTCKTST